MSKLPPESAHAAAGQRAGGFLSLPSRFLILTAAFVVVVAGMQAAVDIINPFLLAVFLAIICTPMLFWLKRKGVPTALAILLISLAILAVGVLVSAVLAASIADFTRSLPEYARRLDETSVQFLDWLEANDIDVQEPVKDFLRFDSRVAINVMRDLLSQLGKLLRNGFLIYLTTVFILMEASALPDKICKVVDSDEGFADLAKIANSVKRYLALKTVLSLVTGLLVMGLLLALNVSYPMVWGMIAFLLNFVPNVGSMIAAVPAVILALVENGFWSAGFTLAGYAVINISIGNFLEPKLMGQRLGLSTLVVFLSLVFWGWVLGPMGMLLSVPLTMTVKIALQANQETHWLAMLLGSDTSPADGGDPKTAPGGE